MIWKRRFVSLTSIELGPSDKRRKTARKDHVSVVRAKQPADLYPDRYSSLSFLCLARIEYLKGGGQQESNLKRTRSNTTTTRTALAATTLPQTCSFINCPLLSCSQTLEQVATEAVSVSTREEPRLIVANHEPSRPQVALECGSFELPVAASLLGGASIA